MSVEELKKRLIRDKGYFKNGQVKKSYFYLSAKYGEPESKIKIAVQQLRKEYKEYVKSKTIKSSDSRVNIRERSLLFTSSKSKLPNNVQGTYWITGCAHAPWHNKKMYDSTLKYLSSEVNLNGLILAGDIIDANSISAHDRGNIALPGVTLDWEYQETNKFLDEIEGALSDNISKHYLYGNHEDRYNRLVRGVDAAKYGDALKSPIEGLYLNERGYQVYTDWKNDSVPLGPYLEVNHGEFCNVHTAKKTIDTYRKSILYFHTHRFQIFMEGQVAGFNMGAGADFTAPVFGYATKAMKTSWTNASALVTIDIDGFYHVQPLLFINNKLIVNGKQY